MLYQADVHVPSLCSSLLCGAPEAGTLIFEDGSARGRKIKKKRAYILSNIDWTPMQ
jgi:hypothetical protein